MRKTSWEQDFGAPDPLGASWIAADRAYNFAIEEGSPSRWKRVVETFLDPYDDILDCDQAASIISDRYTVQSRSVVVLARA